ncbi:hypothetical protein HZS_257, partial [Henneguya salminicola]
MKWCCDYRHRYAILVDNIFDQYVKKGSAQENIDKLTFYAMSYPQKLDRIASRLYDHFNKYYQNRKNEYSKNYELRMILLAFDVTNQLLSTSGSSFTNLIMVDYLRMVLELISNDCVEFQIQSAKSFRKFSTINADTPKFNEFLEPLLKQFVRLCNINHFNVKLNHDLRLAGLVGIQALIIKTKNSATDNVWKFENASLIIPALINNLKPLGDSSESGSVSIPLDDNILPYFNEFITTPSKAISQTLVTSEALSALMDPFSCSPMLVSLNNLRDMLHLSTISKAHSVVSSIYRYWYDNNLWIYDTPSARMIAMISLSLQPQLEHVPIRILFEQILEIKEKTKAINLIKILPLFSTKSMGSSLCMISMSHLDHIYFEILTRLVLFLKESYSSQFKDSNYIDTLTKTIEALVNKLPNFQKSETYQLILNQFPKISVQSQSEVVEISPKQLILNDVQKDECKSMISCLKMVISVSLSQVTRLYPRNNTPNVLNFIFLEQLSECIKLPIPDLKIQVIQTFINLFDQHNNYEIISQYIQNNHVDDLTSPENDLRDVTIKKLVKVAEILCSDIFSSNSTSLEVKELTILLCILSLEVHLASMHEFLCIKLINTKVTRLKSSKVDKSNIILCDLYQSMLYAVINFVSIVSKNSKLRDLCGKVKQARLIINPNFWMPYCLIEYSAFQNIPDIKSDIYFDPKQIEKAFNIKKMTSEQDSINKDNVSVGQTFEIDDNISKDSTESIFKEP